MGKDKTSDARGSVLCITPEIRRKIRKILKHRAKAKETGSQKLRSKFEILRREIKVDVRKYRRFDIADPEIEQTEKFKGQFLMCSTK